MNKPVGGRGKKAPYETILIRIPVPIYSQVEKMADNYRQSVIETDGDNLEQNLEFNPEFCFVSYDDALERAKEILKSKKSAAESLAKLLQVLYGGEVRKEDLK